MNAKSKLYAYLTGKTIQRSKSLGTKTTVQPDTVETTVHIPQSERREDPIFFKPLVAPQVDAKISSVKNWKAILLMFCCKYPRYKFVRSTQSQYTQGRQYWLQDTQRNITVVFSMQEIRQKLAGKL